MTPYKPAFPVQTGDDALDHKLESMAAFSRRFRLPEGMAARCSFETRQGHCDNRNDWFDRDKPEEMMQELEGFCGWAMLLDMHRALALNGALVSSDGRHLTRRERRALGYVIKAWRLMEQERGKQAPVPTEQDPPAKTRGGLFTGPPIDITGGMDAADYIAQLRGQLPDPTEPDPPATRCSTCARDRGEYCSLEADSHHTAWHDSGGFHGGVACACWLAKTGGEAE